jgi:hypothetical protein
LRLPCRFSVPAGRNLRRFGKASLSAPDQIVLTEYAGKTCGVQQDEVMKVLQTVTFIKQAGSGK